MPAIKELMDFARQFNSGDTVELEESGDWWDIEQNLVVRSHIDRSKYKQRFYVNSRVADDAGEDE